MSAILAWILVLLLPLVIYGLAFADARISAVDRQERHAYFWGAVTIMVMSFFSKAVWFNSTWVALGVSIVFGIIVGAFLIPATEYLPSGWENKPPLALGTVLFVLLVIGTISSKVLPGPLKNHSIVAVLLDPGWVMLFVLTHFLFDNVVGLIGPPEAMQLGGRMYGVELKFYSQLKYYLRYYWGVLAVTIVIIFSRISWFNNVWSALVVSITFGFIVAITIPFNDYNNLDGKLTSLFESFALMLILVALLILGTLSINLLSDLLSHSLRQTILISSSVAGGMCMTWFIVRFFKKLKGMGIY